MIKLLINPNTMKVGCALLQAAMGDGAHIAHTFPVDAWETSPEGMHLYELSEEDFKVARFLVQNTLELEAAVRKGQQEFYLFEEGEFHPVIMEDFSSSREVRVRDGDVVRSVSKTHLSAVSPKQEAA